MESQKALSRIGNGVIAVCSRRRISEQPTARKSDAIPTCSATRSPWRCCSPVYPSIRFRSCSAICFDQLCDLLSLEIISERPRSLRWRLARLEKAGLVTRLQGQTHLRTPVFGITQQGLIFLESRGHYLLSLPSAREATLHPFQVPHALEMVSIRVAFTKTGILHSWKSDLEIASTNLVLENGAAKDFDAVAWIEVDGLSRAIGIEYERNPKAAARYRAIRDVLERDQTTDAILYMAANDDLIYLLALELRAMRKRIGFVLSDAFRRSLLETRTLTNSNNSEVVPLRDFLSGNQL
jgi:hypothetical protein